MQYSEDYEYITKSLNRKARRKGKSITESTIRTYVTAVNSYVKFLDTSFCTTLDWDIEKIVDTIEDFKDYLIDEDKANSTINKRVDLLKALYKLGKIDLGSIEKLVVHESNDPDRLPNKNEIRQVLNSTNNKQLQAIILFMATSGCAINEVTREDRADRKRCGRRLRPGRRGPDRRRDGRASRPDARGRVRPGGLFGRPGRRR